MNDFKENQVYTNKTHTHELVILAPIPNTENFVVVISQEGEISQAGVVDAQRLGMMVDLNDEDKYALRYFGIIEERAIDLAHEIKQMLTKGFYGVMKVTHEDSPAFIMAVTNKAADHPSQTRKKRHPGKVQRTENGPESHTGTAVP